MKGEGTLLAGGSVMLPRPGLCLLFFMDLFGTAAILAGGRSSRMGFDKQLLEVQGQPLYKRNIAALRGVFNDIILVTNTPELYADENVRTFSDIYPGKGPLAGIHTALVNSRSRYTFFIACDMTEINRDYINYLQDKIASSSPLPEICATESPSGLETFYSFFDRSLTDKIESILTDSGNPSRSVYKFIINAASNRLIIPASEAAAYGTDLFHNINTRAELAAFKSGSQPGARGNRSTGTDISTGSKGSCTLPGSGPAGEHIGEPLAGSGPAGEHTGEPLAGSGPGAHSDMTASEETDEGAINVQGPLPLVGNMDILKYRGGLFEPFSDPVIHEYSLTLFNKDRPIKQFWCSPSEMREMIIGHLICEGKISSIDDIISLDIHESEGTAQIEFKDIMGIGADDEMADMADNERASGPASTDSKAGSPAAAGSVIPFDISVLLHNLDLFYSESDIFEATGGAHKCAVCNDTGTLFSSIDVRRHNAFDKVMGKAAEEGLRASEVYLITSGRVPIDMVSKAVNSGLKMLVSRAAPTIEAVELARRSGLILLGFARGSRFNLYSTAGK